MSVIAVYTKKTHKVAGGFLLSRRIYDVPLMEPIAKMFAKYEEEMVPQGLYISMLSGKLIGHNFIHG